MHNNRGCDASFLVKNTNTNSPQIATHLSFYNFAPTLLLTSFTLTFPVPLDYHLVSIFLVGFDLTDCQVFNLKMLPIKCMPILFYSLISHSFLGIGL